MRAAYAHKDFANEQTIDPDETLGGRIVHAREIMGLSTAQLARRVGVKTSTLQAWETDRSAPRSNRLVMLASMLNVNIAWLMVGDGDDPGVAAVPPKIDDVKTKLLQLRQQSLVMSEEINHLIARIDA